MARPRFETKKWNPAFIALWDDMGCRRTNQNYSYISYALHFLGKDVTYNKYGKIAHSTVLTALGRFLYQWQRYGDVDPPPEAIEFAKSIMMRCGQESIKDLIQEIQRWKDIWIWHKFEG